MPVNWAARSPRKQGFFRLLSEITGERPGARREGYVFPGKSWATKTSEQAGLDAAKLEQLRAFVGGRGCLVRDGYLVYSWGDRTKRADVASAFKPWLVHLLLRSVDQGVIRTLDDPVAAWEPRLMHLNPDLAFKDRRITWRQLASPTSCYGVREAPGEAFDYSDDNRALFFDTLVLKVYQTSHARTDADVLHPQLSDLLECQDEPTFLAFGLKDRPGRLAVSIRDSCRFGLLYLCNGEWNGSQLLSPRLVEMAVTSPLPTPYPGRRGRRRR